MTPSMPARARSLPLVPSQSPVPGGTTLLQQASANEYFFAVVGHIGSGITTAAKQIVDRLQQSGIDTVYIKASDSIREFATSMPPSLSPAEETTSLQDAGNRLRAERGHDAVAKEVIRLIRENRALKIGATLKDGQAVKPDGKRRAYVVDSIRHPAEAHLLRNLYGNAFALVGVVCSEDERRRRLIAKLNIGVSSADQLMARDAAEEDQPHGQQVARAFHLADAFLDNSSSKEVRDGKLPADWRLPEDVGRLVDTVLHSRIVRPTASETGMFHAHASRLRSACLSRQVGAAIVGPSGDIIAVGRNEVPKAGGGAYGSFDLDEELLEVGRDERCAYSSTYKACSNTTEVKAVVRDVVQALTEAGVMREEDRPRAEKIVEESRVGALIEFSRAVHAEMDALISAGRTGRSVVGATAFVTTFPCHYCARHLVAAGVDAVYFIEPYPKSRAFHLHSDSIAYAWEEGAPSQKGTRVKFAPFTGVAPRMYERAFLKNRPLKDGDGLRIISQPEHLDAWHVPRLDYSELEAQMTDHV